MDLYVLKTIPNSSKLADLLFNFFSTIMMSPAPWSFQNSYLDALGKMIVSIEFGSSEPNYDRLFSLLVYQQQSWAIILNVEDVVASIVSDLHELIFITMSSSKSLCSVDFFLTSSDCGLSDSWYVVLKIVPQLVIGYIV